MRHFKTIFHYCVIFLSLFLVSCNDTPATTPEKNDKDYTSPTTVTEVNNLPEYDPAMDSYNIGGEKIKKLGDTLGVKMYEFTAKPGQSFGLHTHPDHTAYILQGGKAALYVKELGRVDTIDFPTGMALISGPLSDSGKNIGKTTIRMIVTDIYRPRNK